jgi:hypothetical protein
MPGWNERVLAALETMAATGLAVDVAPITGTAPNSANLFMVNGVLVDIRGIAERAVSATDEPAILTGPYGAIIPGPYGAIAATRMGTGPAITVSGAGLLADPGNNNWSAAIVPSPITRFCTLVRYDVGAGGFRLSLDGGQTIAIDAPPNSYDNSGVPLMIPAGADIRIQRYTPGVAIAALTVRVY